MEDKFFILNFVSSFLQTQMKKTLTKIEEESPVEIEKALEEAF